MTGKTDISVIRHNIGCIDARLERGITGRINSRLVTSALWTFVFRRRYYAFPRLALFYLLSPDGNSRQTAGIWTVNAYLNFFMKTERTSADISGTGPIPNRGITDRGSHNGHSLTHLYKRTDSPTLRQIADMRDLMTVQHHHKHELNISRDSGHLFIINKPTTLERSPLLPESTFTEKSQENYILKHKSPWYFPGEVAAGDNFRGIGKGGRRWGMPLNAEPLLSHVNRINAGNIIQSGNYKTMGAKHDGDLPAAWDFADAPGLYDQRNVIGRHLIYKGPSSSGEEYSRPHTGNAASTPAALRLDYLQSGESGLKGNLTSTKIQETLDIVSNKNIRNGRTTADPKTDINVPKLADEVYRLIENRIRTEKERRGIFR